MDPIAVWSTSLTPGDLALRGPHIAAGPGVVELAVGPGGDVALWQSFEADEDTPAGTAIHYQLSTDGGATWLWWDGTLWRPAKSAIPAEATDAATIDAHIDALQPSAYGLRVRAILTTTDPLATPSLHQISVSWASLP